jgi:hypothetical protein
LRGPARDEVDRQPIAEQRLELLRRHSLDLGCAGFAVQADLDAVAIEILAQAIGSVRLVAITFPHRLSNPGRLVGGLSRSTGNGRETTGDFLRGSLL